jgi:hypothetical protein
MLGSHRRRKTANVATSTAIQWFFTSPIFAEGLSSKFSWFNFHGRERSYVQLCFSRACNGKKHPHTSSTQFRTASMDPPSSSEAPVTVSTALKIVMASVI